MKWRILCIIGLLCVGAAFFWIHRENIEGTAPPFFRSTSQQISGDDKPQTNDNKLDGTPLLSAGQSPVLVKSAVPAKKHRNRTATRGLLKAKGIESDTDIVREFLDGKRDKEKFLRARDFLKSLGGKEEDEGTAVQVLFNDTDTKAWKDRMTKFKQGSDAVEKKNPVVKGTENSRAILKLGTESAAILAGMIDPDNFPISGDGALSTLAYALQAERYLEEGATAKSCKNQVIQVYQE